MRFTDLSTESSEYAAARDALRLAEIDLMQRQEAVAALRRALPPGPVVDEYVFNEDRAPLSDDDAEVRPARLSELFSGTGRALIVYHLMFGKLQGTPCPMCTMWIDGFNGIVNHLSQNADFAVVAAADVVPLRAHARSRGWDNVRLLSAGQSSFKADFGSEDVDGNQDSRISVFTKELDGSVRHFYTSSPRMSDEIDQRGIDLLCATWNLLDLTPHGRGEWYSSLHYE